jgi:DNA repair protein RecO (recombination protein O)
MATLPRIDDEPAYVLHTYPYRETSLIVEAFTERHGRVALVARGAKRARSELRGVLQAFQPLTLGWTGNRELKTLMRAEWQGGLPLPAGGGLLCAFYLNELLLKLLAREDPHPALYNDYEATLAALVVPGKPGEPAPVLRRFELALLVALGYGLNLARDVDTGDAVDAGARYYFAVERGARRLPARMDGRGLIVQGATLVALATATYPDSTTAAEAKQLMRMVLDHHLDARRIFSRRIVQDLQALEEREES